MSPLRRLFLKSLALPALAAGWRGAGAGEWLPAGVPRLLFVGNSLSSFNDGVDRHLEGLASRRLQIETIYLNGSTLQLLWRMPGVQWRLRAGHHDWVVLQDDMPEYAPARGVADFRESVRRFALAARQSGARPVLFMAWPYRRLGWISGEEIARAHREAAMELGLAVAPVGAAFQRVERERPGLGLRQGDGEHPNSRGTYLAAAVLQASLFGDVPAAPAWRPEGLAEGDAAYLRQVAAGTVRDWR